MASKRVAAKTIQITHADPTTIGVDDIKHERAVKRCNERNSFITFSDCLAQSVDYIMNVKWDLGDVNYPNSPEMRTVNKFYPNAKGGPLYVDEPNDEQNATRCYEKQTKMRKLGLRYVVIEKNMGLYDVQMQLEESERNL
jgi:hypothetical protein